MNSYSMSKKVHDDNHGRTLHRSYVVEPIDDSALVEKKLCMIHSIDEVFT